VQIQEKMKEQILPLVIAAAVGVLLGRIIFNLNWVPTPSMEPTIKKKSLHLGWALPFFFGKGQPKRGDIVVFRQAERKNLLLKRVIAIGGDTVDIHDGDVYLNDTLLQEPYLKTQHSTLSGRKTFVVPDECFSAMGDNRYGSADARVWKTPYTPYRNIRSRILF